MAKAKVFHILEFNDGKTLKVSNPVYNALIKISKIQVDYSTNATASRSNSFDLRKNGKRLATFYITPSRDIKNNR